MGQRHAGEQKGPSQIDPQRAIPTLRRVFCHRQRIANAVVADEDVKAAVRRDGASDRVLGALDGRHVAGHRERPPVGDLARPPPRAARAGARPARRRTHPRPTVARSLGRSPYRRPSPARPCPHPPACVLPRPGPEAGPYASGCRGAPARAATRRAGDRSPTRGRPGRRAARVASHVASGGSRELGAAGLDRPREGRVGVGDDEEQPPGRAGQRARAEPVRGRVGHPEARRVDGQLRDDVVARATRCSTVAPNAAS